MIPLPGQLRDGNCSAHAVGDQHLLVEAPAHALHRLRKAELVRLWKVAGMWNEEEHGDGLEEDESIGMSKKDLVDGLVAGVSCSRSGFSTI